jgi:penicillin G amidase
MKYLPFSLSLAAGLALIWVLSTRWGNIPPMGPFMDPDGGFWAQAERQPPSHLNDQLLGLMDSVQVFFDDRRVPHVFAQNDHDLYFMQGFLQARDRLFQMEMQTYDAAGRLSELIGPSLVERDRQSRRWGMVFGAEKAVAEVQKHEPSWTIFKAYSSGVNAFISSLEPEQYPLEYKLLDISPEPWTPLKTALLLKNMTRTLAAGNSDVSHSNTLAYFGPEFVEQFFDKDHDLLDPIIPASRVWDFERVPVRRPDTLFVPKVAKSIQPFPVPEGIGSNNWAVSGEKTASGYPILSNDPHLRLTLPSIWYEIQLHAPGVNTYGVSLLGAPGVVIGFNEQVAWGVTNVASDVLDWYEIRFENQTKERYWHDEQWKATSKRIEEIHVRGGETIIDTVVYTHHGPVSEVSSANTNGQRTNGQEGSTEPIYHALRWIAHEPSNEIRAFYQLNRAKNYSEYVEALTHYQAPAQNFVFASTDGDIALWVNGRFPNKWDGQGRTVSDGTDPVYDWQGWIPREHHPYTKNPERGFVSSANQESTAPDYPYYMDDVYAPFERGRRINERLSELENITKEDMQALLMDNYSYHAAEILPSMLSWIQTDSLNATQSEVLDSLRTWNYYNNASYRAPSVFRSWWYTLYEAILVDEYDADFPLRTPARDRMVQQLKEDSNFWMVDHRSTEVVETIEDQATQSFISALNDLTEAYGVWSDDWDWGWVMNNDIPHLTQTNGLGVNDLYSSGGAESVNATRGSSGPSWRMIVELGPEIKAWGVYPGGASGNPGSPNYDHMIESWRTGKLYELHFYKAPPIGSTMSSGQESKSVVKWSLRP